MPIAISPDGQAVFCLTQDGVNDLVRQGYRTPPPEQGTSPRPVPEAASGGPLDLMTATLAELRDLPDVGTARARKIRELAKAGTLNLDTLQAEVSEVDWVSMYNQGLVAWPGGLHLAKAEEPTE